MELMMDNIGHSYSFIHAQHGPCDTLAGYSNSYITYHGLQSAYNPYQANISVSDVGSFNGGAGSRLVNINYGSLPAGDRRLQHDDDILRQQVSLSTSSSSSAAAAAAAGYGSTRRISQHHQHLDGSYSMHSLSTDLASAAAAAAGLLQSPRTGNLISSADGGQLDDTSRRIVNFQPPPAHQRHVQDEDMLKAQPRKFFGNSPMTSPSNAEVTRMSTTGSGCRGDNSPTYSMSSGSPSSTSPSLVAVTTTGSEDADRRHLQAANGGLVHYPWMRTTKSHAHQWKAHWLG
jgi:hypothetical protein